MLGAALALVSAACFGLNNAAIRRGVLKATVLQGMAITVPFGVPLLLAATLATGGLEAMRAWPVAGWSWMIAAGVVHFVVGRYGNYRATVALGATLSTPIQQMSILVALVLGFLFLGESVNAVNLLGILVLVVGPMVLIRRRGAASRAGAAKGFEPDYPAGFLWGAVCALGYGTSPLFIALGLGAAGGASDAIAGAFVSYLAATVVVIALVVRAGGRRYLVGIDRSGAKWFLLSALFVGFSQLFRYLALSFAPLTVVVPIQRLSVVFRLIFNALINRDHEVFDRWVVATILLAVFGATAVAADTGALLAWFGLSGGLAAALSAPLV